LGSSRLTRFSFPSSRPSKLRQIRINCSLCFKSSLTTRIPSFKWEKSTDNKLVSSFPLVLLPPPPRLSFLSLLPFRLSSRLSSLPANLASSFSFVPCSDLSQASEYIDRALFAFERAFAPGFNIAQGNVRLDFDRVENRGFYLALIRNLQCVSNLLLSYSFRSNENLSLLIAFFLFRLLCRFLGRRGCWVTSFTFAKLLLAMDPHTDVRLLSDLSLTLSLALYPLFSPFSSIPFLIPPH